VIIILKIALCVSSSISIYKSLDLTSKLKQAGHEVMIAMTPNAQKLVSEAAFKSLSKNETITDLFSGGPAIAHIAITEWCDVLVIAPATYNLVSKIACGIADDTVTTIAAACGIRKPFIIAPAMNTNMYENPVFIENLNKLRKFKNYHIMEAAEGHLACGSTGRGRMAPIEKIIEAIEKYTGQSKNLTLKTNIDNSLYNKNIIITAGPTREFIDSVRFLSNPSSGRMGYALAEEAAGLGARVTLISGPVEIQAPDGIDELIKVNSTKEMLDTVMSRFPSADVLISAAAPCDFTFNLKLTKKAAKADLINKNELKLTATPDILKAAANIKTTQIIAGFAAEDNNHLKNAIKKLKSKFMDIIVLNDVSSKETGFAAVDNKITIIKKGHEASPENYEKTSKKNCARIILNHIASIINENNKKRKAVRI